MSALLPLIEKELFRTFRSKRKFIQGNYAIFLTNQFYKQQFIDEIRNRFKDVETVVTSGTIKKCKASIEFHRKNLLSQEKEISTLL